MSFQQHQSRVVFYSPRNLNLELILKMIMEHSPGWIIDESRKQWILYAIETKDYSCSIYKHMRVFRIRCWD